MKVLIVADVKSNNGPANVHKEIVGCWPDEDELRLISSENFLVQQYEVLKSSRWADVAIISGKGWSDYLSHDILRLMHVPVLVFNHGYMPYENEINDHGFSDIKVKAAIRDLSHADLIVANSELQGAFLKKKLPKLENRIRYMRLGVNEFPQARRCGSKAHAKKLVAVSGGDRPIKGNDIVIQAVRLLRNDGHDVELKIYGEVLKADVEREEWIDYRTQLGREAFIEELAAADCFVMNSRHEPFGLSALDALEAGVSVLLSQNCGVKEVMDMIDDDVIEDCESVNEVQAKLMRVFNCPNYERLYRSIDFDKCSWIRSTKKLRNYCLALLK